MSQSKLRFGVFVCLVLALFLSRNWLEFQFLTPSEKFAHIWQEDLETLQKQNFLPKSWPQIRSVELLPNDLKKDIWPLKVAAPMALNFQGDRRLEVLLLPWIREGQYGVTVNYYLLEAENRNTVWEFGRTYTIGSAKELN